MAGLINVGRQYRNQAMSGLSQAEGLAKARERTGEQIEQAEKSQKMSAVGAGAGIGAMMGMQAGAVGGPAGMAIGAGVGLLASTIF